MGFIRACAILSPDTAVSIVSTSAENPASLARLIPLLAVSTPPHR